MTAQLIKPVHAFAGSTEATYLVSLFIGQYPQRTVSAVDLEEVSHISSQWVEAGGTGVLAVAIASFEVLLKNETYAEDGYLITPECWESREVFTSLAKAISFAKVHLESGDTGQLRGAEVVAQCDPKFIDLKLVKPVKVYVGGQSYLPEPEFEADYEFEEEDYLQNDEGDV